MYPHECISSKGKPRAKPPAIEAGTAAGTLDHIECISEDEALPCCCRSGLARHVIPKPDGGERALGIPTIRDRVIQTAARLVLEPIFEADFAESAYGYRPICGAVDAVEELQRFAVRLTFEKAGKVDITAVVEKVGVTAPGAMSDVEM